MLSLKYWSNGASRGSLSTLWHNFRPPDFFWPLNIRSWHSFRNAGRPRGARTPVTTRCVAQMLHALLKDRNLRRNKARQQLLTPRGKSCDFRISRVLGKNRWGSVREGTAPLHAAGWRPGRRLSAPEPQRLASPELTVRLGRLKHLSCVFQASGTKKKKVQKKKVPFWLEYSPFNSNTSLPRELSFP